MTRRFFNAVLLVALSMTLTTSAQAQFGNFFGKKSAAPEISTEELLRLQADQTTDETQAAEAKQPVPEPSFVLVDVRSPKEQAVSILPGAITVQQLEANRAAYQGRTIVTYCTVGGRSGAYARKLIKQGLTAKNYKGSLLAWCNAKQPLVTLQGESTNRVHVYSSRYKVPDEYVAEW